MCCTIGGLPCLANKLQGFSCMWFPWSPRGMSQLEHVTDVFMESMQ